MVQRPHALTPTLSFFLEFKLPASVISFSIVML